MDRESENIEYCLQCYQEIGIIQVLACRQLSTNALGLVVIVLDC